jgi:Mrp family chromosome partitioning ATPase
MLCTLRNNYGLVIVDSPPCLGVGDALVLSAIADYTVFVVRWGRTAAAQVAGALDFLSQRGANIMGFVLNWIDTGAYDAYAVSYGDCRGGYGYYRRYYTKRGWLTGNVMTEGRGEMDYGTKS